MDRVTTAAHRSAMVCPLSTARACRSQALFCQLSFGCAWPWQWPTPAEVFVQTGWSSDSNARPGDLAAPEHPSPSVAGDQTVHVRLHVLTIWDRKFATSPCTIAHPVCPGSDFQTRHCLYCPVYTDCAYYCSSCDLSCWNKSDYNGKKVEVIIIKEKLIRSSHRKGHQRVVCTESCFGLTMGGLIPNRWIKQPTWIANPDRK